MLGILGGWYVACSQNPVSIPTCSSPKDCDSSQTCVNQMCISGSTSITNNNTKTTQEIWPSSESLSLTESTPEWGLSGDASTPEAITNTPETESTETTSSVCPSTCRSSTDCAQCTGQTSCRNGRCQPPQTSCSRDSDCTSQEICNNNRCTPGCRDSRQCEPQHICNNNQCVPGCKQDSDCTPTNICTNDRCVPGCRKNSDCSGKLKICDNTRCVECKEDKDCPPGQKCSGSRTCQKD